MNSVILGPVITEKSMNAIKGGRYTFKVAMWADKNQIKMAIKDKFQADAVDIATMHVKKRKKITMRREVTEPAWKKAVVKVKSGQKIDLFTVEQKGKK